MFAPGLYLTTSISVGDPIIYNEISGDEYSTLPVHEQPALRALRTTGPFTFKPEVLKQGWPRPARNRAMI
jgi:hypothetical protein